MKPKMAVGRCCCTPLDCVICQDDFDRTSGTDIDTDSDCGWTEQSGDWWIVSDLFLRGKAVGIATCDTSQAGASPQVYIKVEVNFDENGDQIAVVVNWVDSDNYDFVELTAGGSSNGSIKVYERIAGVETEIFGINGVDVDLGVWLSLEVCLDVTSLLATFERGKTDEAKVSGAVTATNGVVGLAVRVVAVAASGPLFDNWTFENHAEKVTGCPSCLNLCSYCDDGLIPDKVDIAIALIVDDSCADCDDGVIGFNRIFTDVPLKDPTASGVMCTWQADIGALGYTACEATGTNAITFQIVDATTIRVTLTIRGLTASSQTIIWEKTLSSPIDCDGFSSQSLDFDSQTGSPFDYCDASSSTCSATAA